MAKHGKCGKLKVKIKNSAGEADEMDAGRGVAWMKKKADERRKNNWMTTRYKKIKNKNQQLSHREFHIINSLISQSRIEKDES